MTSSDHSFGPIRLGRVADATSGSARIAATAAPGSPRRDRDVERRVEVAARTSAASSSVDLPGTGARRQNGRVDADEPHAERRQAEHDEQQSRSRRRRERDGASPSARTGTRRRAPPVAQPRAAARCQRAGASALIRSPRSTKSAGRTSRETAPASGATMIPPIAIERRNGSGKTSSEANAAATVTALNATVRPAVASVVVHRSEPGPSRAISSR